MTSILNFKVLIEKDEDGYFIVSVPAIPGCHTQGKSYEEAVTMVKEAIELCLEVAKTDKDYRELISFPTKGRQESFIGVLDIPISTRFVY